MVELSLLCNFQDYGLNPAVAFCSFLCFVGDQEMVDVKMEHQDCQVMFHQTLLDMLSKCWVEDCQVKLLKEVDVTTQHLFCLMEAHSY